jgi:hypothetical protein
VTGFLSNNAFKITSTGTITQLIASPRGDNPRLFGPSGIAVDGFGNVSLAAMNSNNAYMVTPTGTITRLIDSSGDGTHNFSSPYGIATDAAGNIYLTASGSNNAFKLSGLVPPQTFVHLRANTRVASSMIRLQAVFDASPLGDLGQVLSDDGLSVVVSGAGLPAPERMTFLALACFDQGRVIECVGTKGEEARLLKRKGSAVKLRITAPHRSFSPSLTSTAATFDLSIGAGLSGSQSTTCKVRGKGMVALCPK